MPIVKFSSRIEGDIHDEVFVKPAKVNQKIPVVDSNLDTSDKGNQHSCRTILVLIIFII